MSVVSHSYVKAGAQIFLILFLLLSGERGFAQSGETPLLSDLDIPLMQGFQEQENSRVVFDTPEGRIIEVNAEGRHEPQDVFDYYQLVLSSLGWRVRDTAPQTETCKSELSFCIIAERDRERLTVKISPSQDTAGLTVISFLVDPK